MLRWSTASDFMIWILNIHFVPRKRHGFLSFREVARECYHPDAKISNGRPSIKDVLREGQEILLQVDKEERGNKGAALTTYISLAGRYLVLMPNNPRAGGVSRRIEGEDRQHIKQTLSDLDIPEGMGAIVRTAGVDREAEELSWDLDYLKTLWEAIQSASGKHKAPVLLYQESNVIIRALRDYFRRDIGEIVIDDNTVYKQAHDFMQAVMPHNLRKLKHYQDSTPLLSRYQVEHQIETAFQREVTLPSGGAIVIDHTEALLSIDINSARATKGKGIEETALNTNLEAADEIARQLRLRDLGGLIVIDFIDMLPSKHQREVERRLKEALKVDRARVQVGRISRFGLLEMSRQRLRPSLGESSQIVCPRCVGQGSIRNTDSLALSILRLMEEESMKEMTGRVMARVPVTVASFLLNEKRDALTDVQRRRGIELSVIPDPYLDTPHFDIIRVRSDENAATAPSYTRISAPPDIQEDSQTDTEEHGGQAPETAVVSNVVPSQPAPQIERKPKTTQATETLDIEKNPGLIRRILHSLFGTNAKTEEPVAEVRKAQKERKRQSKTAPQNKQKSQGHNNRNNPNQSQSGHDQSDEQKSQSRRTRKPRKNNNGNGQQKDQTPVKAITEHDHIQHEPEISNQTGNDQHRQSASDNTDNKTTNHNGSLRRGRTRGRGRTRTGNRTQDRSQQTISTAEDKTVATETTEQPSETTVITETQTTKTTTAPVQPVEQTVSDAPAHSKDTAHADHKETTPKTSKPVRKATRKPSGRRKPRSIADSAENQEPLVIDLVPKKPHNENRSAQTARAEPAAETKTAKPAQGTQSNAQTAEKPTNKQNGNDSDQPKPSRTRKPAVKTPKPAKTSKTAGDKQTPDKPAETVVKPAAATEKIKAKPAKTSAKPVTTGRATKTEPAATNTDKPAKTQTQVSQSVEKPVQTAKQPDKTVAVKTDKPKETSKTEQPASKTPKASTTSKPEPVKAEDTRPKQSQPAAEKSVEAKQIEKPAEKKRPIWMHSE